MTFARERLIFTVLSRHLRPDQNQCNRYLYIRNSYNSGVITCCCASFLGFLKVGDWYLVFTRPSTPLNCAALAIATCLSISISPNLLRLISCLLSFRWRQDLGHWATCCITCYLIGFDNSKGYRYPNLDPCHELESRLGNECSYWDVSNIPLWAMDDESRLGNKEYLRWKCRPSAMLW
jgi:hypothetical protein